jgi:hypothetical protein
MANYNSILKPTAYLTVQEVSEWLGIKAIKIDVPQAEVKASRAIQNLLYTSKLVGTLGNATSIEYIGGATAGAEVVSMTLNKITVQIEDGVSTALQIKTAIEASSLSNPLVTVTFIDPSVGAETQTLQSEVSLTGGINDVPFDKDVEELRRLIERLINISCDKVESILQTRVVAQPYEEKHDGNNANVIVPSKWPITELTEIKIDYNAGFGPETIIDLQNATLRGFADRRQKVTDLSLRIVGNDIALRDDNKDSFIGKIFSGSVIGAIKIKYKAGWAIDKDDIPWDLLHATTLLVEYYYFQRSNRDLNISSKGVRGESFSKIKDGIPDTIHELLEPYIDCSLPLFEKSQTNTFDI